MAIAANKSDISEERRVSVEKAKEYAKEQAIPQFHTSAKDAVGVDELFLYIAKSIILSINIYL